MSMDGALGINVQYPLLWRQRTDAAMRNRNRNRNKKFTCYLLSAKRLMDNLWRVRNQEALQIPISTFHSRSIQSRHVSFMFSYSFLALQGQSHPLPMVVLKIPEQIHPCIHLPKSYHKSFHSSTRTHSFTFCIDSHYTKYIGVRRLPCKTQSVL